MTKDNIAEDSRIPNLTKQVAEMQDQLDESLKRTSGLSWNNRNWEAVKGTLEINEKRLEDLNEQINIVKNMVMTMQTQFQQFQQQRATELNHFLSNRQTQTVRDEDRNE